MAVPKGKLLDNYLGQLSNNKLFFIDAEVDDNGVPGGYLLRWEHDLNGDGIDDYFFATTVNPDQQGVEWTAYLSDGENSFYRPIEHCFFHPAGVYDNKNGDRREIGTIVLADIQNAHVFAYSLDDSGQIVRAERSLTDDELFLMGSAEKADFSESFGLGKIIPCRVEKLALADAVSEGFQVWKPFSTDYEIDKQHLDPREADSVNRLENVSISSVLDQLAVFDRKSRSRLRPALSPGQGGVSNTTQGQPRNSGRPNQTGISISHSIKYWLLPLVVLLAFAGAIFYSRMKLRS